MWVVAHTSLQLGSLKDETRLSEMFMSRPSLAAKRLGGFKWSRKAMSAGLAGGAYFRTILRDVML